MGQKQQPQKPQPTVTKLRISHVQELNACTRPRSRPIGRPRLRPLLAYVALPVIAWALFAGVGIGFVALVAHLVRPG